MDSDKVINPDPVKRAASVKANSTVGFLIRALEDEDARVREAAADRLYQLNDSYAVEPLIRALGDKDRRVRVAVALALRRLGEPLGMLFLRDRHALEELAGRRDPRFVEPLIELLKNSDSDVCKAAAEALGQIDDARAIDPRFVEPLIELLKNSDSDVRKAAAEALGRIGDVRAVEPLIRALGDWYVVRKAAAEALGRIVDVRAVEPLIRALGDSYARDAAAHILKRLGETVGMVFLEVLRGDRSAMEQLANSRDARVVEPLIGTLSDWDINVRRAAAEAANMIWSVSYEKVPSFLCPTHLTRFEKKTAAKASLLSLRVSYAACRVCGKPWPMIEVREVVAVLDKECGQDLVENREILRVNWPLRKDLFDFDRVEIGAVKDMEVEQFVIRVQNDMDEFRRKRYKNISCTIDSNGNLSEHTLCMLRSVFGSVEPV